MRDLAVNDVNLFNEVLILVTGFWKQLLPRTMMHLAFLMYIKALPSIIDKKTEMLVVDFWRAFNRELTFIVPHGA